MLQFRSSNGRDLQFSDNIKECHCGIIPNYSPYRGMRFAHVWREFNLLVTCKGVI